MITEKSTRKATDLDRRVTALSAMALGEEAIAAGLPIPFGITVNIPGNRYEPVSLQISVTDPDGGIIDTYQSRFGGVVHEEVHANSSTTLHRTLNATVRGVPLRVVSVHFLTECEHLAWFINSHGVRDDWSPETVTQYLHGFAGCRP